MTVGVLALQGDVREHAAALGRSGRAGPPGPRARPTSTAWPAWSCPVGSRPPCRCCSSRPACSTRWPSALADGLPAFGTCAGMILLAADGARRPRRPAPLRGHRPRRPPQRLRAPGGLVRDRPRRSPALGDEPVARRVHPGPGGRAGRARRRGAGHAAADRARRPGRRRPGHRWSAGRARCWSASFHPELTGDRRLHQLFVEMTKEERR